VNLTALAVAAIKSRGLRPNPQLIAELAQEAQTAIALDPSPPDDPLHRKRRNRIIARRTIRKFLHEILPPIKVPDTVACNGHRIPVAVDYDESALLRNDDPRGFFIVDERPTRGQWRRYRAATRKLARIAREEAIHPHAVAGVNGILAGQSLAAVAKSIGIHPQTLKSRLQDLALPIIERAGDDFDIYRRVKSVRRM
jgi:hypothetical protein